MFEIGFALLSFLFCDLSFPMANLIFRIHMEPILFSLPCSSGYFVHFRVLNVFLLTTWVMLCWTLSQRFFLVPIVVVGLGGVVGFLMFFTLLVLFVCVLLFRFLFAKDICVFCSLLVVFLMSLFVVGVIFPLSCVKLDQNIQNTWIFYFVTNTQHIAKKNRVSDTPKIGTNWWRKAASRQTQKPNRPQKETISMQTKEASGPQKPRVTRLSVKHGNSSSN